MAVSERQLEENEARIDNILHKIISSSEQINSICAHTNANTKGELLVENIKRINLLSEIIFNLAHLADDIDIKDEELTAELETEITQGLDKAITDISETKSLLG